MLRLRTKNKMQAFGAVALLALFYLVLTICKKVADNLKVRVKKDNNAIGRF